jgi:hypothetical protein
VWCVWVRGFPPPYIGVWGSLRELGSLNLVAHPRTALLALMVVSTSKWGQGGGLEGTATTLARAPGPVSLGPIFALLLPYWAWITVPRWSWLGSALDWLVAPLLPFYAFLESVFFMCTTCILYVFLHSDNYTSTSGIQSIVNVYVCIDV